MFGVHIVVSLLMTTDKPLVQLDFTESQKENYPGCLIQQRDDDNNDDDEDIEDINNFSIEQEEEESQQKHHSHIDHIYIRNSVGGGGGCTGNGLSTLLSDDRRSIISLSSSSTTEEISLIPEVTFDNINLDSIDNRESQPLLGARDHTDGFHNHFPGNLYFIFHFIQITFFGACSFYFNM